MKWHVLIIAAMAIMVAALAVCASMRARATLDERTKTLPGDALIPQPIGLVNQRDHHSPSSS